MHVTRNTPDQLILADTPWFMGIMLILFILIFAGAGLLIMSKAFWPGLLWTACGCGMGVAGFAVFVRRVQVILDRPSNSVTLRRQSLFGYQSVRHQLDHLGQAVAETTTSQNHDTGTRTILTRPVLEFDRGMSVERHPIVEAYTSGNGAARLVNAVNTWLEEGGHANGY
jgi:hypothetical protein